MPIARAIRAEVRARYVLELSRPAMAAEAQDDAKAALHFLQNNPFVYAASSQANYVAHILYKETGEGDKEALQSMKKDIVGSCPFYAHGKAA